MPFHFKLLGLIMALNLNAVLFVATVAVFIWNQFVANVVPLIFIFGISGRPTRTARGSFEPLTSDSGGRCHSVFYLP